jgi:hypothetical protein
MTDPERRQLRWVSWRGATLLQEQWYTRTPNIESSTARPQLLQDVAVTGMTSKGPWVKMYGYSCHQLFVEITDPHGTEGLGPF